MYHQLTPALAQERLANMAAAAERGRRPERNHGIRRRARRVPAALDSDPRLSGPPLTIERQPLMPQT